jgi:hypothetical protein
MKADIIRILHSNSQRLTIDALGLAALCVPVLAAFFVPALF